MSRTVDDAGAGLVLRPFRGVRYVEDAVDLAAVTSPPYDLIGPGEAASLEARSPHNLVRLTLPDRHAPDARYARAGRLLGEWLDDGVLRRDATPALYVYESRDGGQVQRGLIGAIELRAPEERVILPHEDVHPVPVADRLEQMRTTGANLEPIYLLTPGTGAAADVVARAADETPLLAAQSSWNARDVDYRLWAVTDPDALATIASALRDRQALIADGHHRYAAYRAQQAERHAAGAGPGAWDYGLAFLVDSAAHPPTLQAIHRVVAGLDPAAVLASLPADATVVDAGGTVESALAACASAVTRHPDTHTFILAGDGDLRLVTLPSPRPHPTSVDSPDAGIEPGPSEGHGPEPAGSRHDPRPAGSGHSPGSAGGGHGSSDGHGSGPAGGGHGPRPADDGHGSDPGHGASAASGGRGPATGHGDGDGQAGKTEHNPSATDGGQDSGTGHGAGDGPAGETEHNPSATDGGQDSGTGHGGGIGHGSDPERGVSAASAGHGAGGSNAQTGSANTTATPDAEHNRDASPGAGHAATTPGDGHTETSDGAGRLGAELRAASPVGGVGRVAVHGEASSTGGGSHSAAWYGLDVTVLHEVLLQELLHVPDERVSFVHTADEAVRQAKATNGSAFLLNPPAEADVHEVAAAGDRMPRKSTSFGPKPRNGLVLRLLSS